MKKALVLAAGFGKRLRPFTGLLPKALVPVWGVPLLEHTLRRLESWKVEEITVNAHAHAEQIRQYIAKRKNRAEIRVRVEERILGTGGALKPLRSFFGDEPFWVVNADAVSSLSPDGLIRAFGESGSFASVWLEPKKGPRTVEADRKMRITSYKSEEPGTIGTYTFCGLHLLSPAIFDYLEKSEFSSIITAYERAMHDGLFATGVVEPESYWADCGTPGSLLSIHGEIKSAAFRKKPGAELYNAKYDRIPLEKRGYFCVCPKSKVPESVKAENSVILPGTVLEEDSRVKSSVLMGGSYAGSLSNVFAVAAPSDGGETPEAVLATGFGGGKIGIQSLGARGSDRAFWRLFKNRSRAIGIVHSGVRQENDRYSKHAAILKGIGVPVPEVLAEDAERRMLILEDWGEISLQSAVKSRPYDALKLYGPVVDSLALMHRDGLKRVEALGVETEPAFDERLYAWERELFREHLLDKRYGITEFPKAAERELKKVAAGLLKQPAVLVHRDMQSSNVLLRGGRHVFIDFQGMRPGAAVYDLASLLYDPYVRLCVGDRCKLAERYRAFFPNRDVLRDGLLNLGAIQRLTQALGAFGRLSSVGQTSFALHIRPALDTLLEISESCKLRGMSELCSELLERERWRRDRSAMPEDLREEGK